jgi:hypothetical protein
MDPASAAALADKLGTATSVQMVLGCIVGVLLMVCVFLGRELLASLKERIKEGTENGRSAAQVAAALQANADVQRLAALRRSA